MEQLQAFVLLVGMMSSSVALALQHNALAAVFLLWSIAMAFALRAARRSRD